MVGVVTTLSFFVNGLCGSAQEIAEQETQSILEQLEQLQQSEQESEYQLPRRAVHISEETLEGGQFDFGHFFGGNFFIASSITGALNHSVSRIVSNNQTVNIVPLAINELISSKAFTAMTLLNNRFPVVAMQTNAESDGSLNKIVLIKQDGAQVISNSDRLNDGNASPVAEMLDGSVVALAASHDTIFALVPPNGGTFGEENSGLIRLKESTANGVTSLRTVLLPSGNFGAAPAYRIDTGAATIPYNPSTDLVNFGTIQSEIGSNATMCWDDHLKRLFIGFTRVTPVGMSSGSIVFCLVGRFQNDVAGQQFVLEPVFDLKDDANSNLNNSDKDYGVALKADQESNYLGSLFHIRIMHTSTGRSYLIGNGGVVKDVGDALQLNTRVFALPLIQQESTLGPRDIGAVASSINHQVRPTAAADVPFVRTINTGVLEYAREVGGDQNYLDHRVDNANTKIEDMQVIGDTVYVSIAGPRADEQEPGEQGVFASTALFDVNGAIVGWTPWERMMGRIERAFSLGVDPFSQRFFYTTGSIDNPTTPRRVKVTEWGAGDFKSFNDGGIHNNVPLSLALDGISNAEPHFGPVYGLFNFDDETPGFFNKNLRPAFSANPSRRFAAVSLLISTGCNRAALIQTGFEDVAGESLFRQVIEFNHDNFPRDDDGEQIIDGGEIARVAIIKEAPGLGDIVTAELARVPVGVVADAEHKRGWVFIGGEGGVAVLSDSNGNGWNTDANGSAGLEFLDDSFGDIDAPEVFPGGNEWQFKRLKRIGETAETSFPDTRKLVSDGRFLYIVTKNRVWRITLDGPLNNFRKGFKDDNCLVPANNLIEIASASSTLAAGQSDNFTGIEFTDLMVVNKTDNNRELLLMTNKGLWMNTNELQDNGTANGKTALAGLIWQQKLAGEIVEAHFLGEKRGGVFGSVNTEKLQNFAYGNLYLTTIQNQATIDVYRFQLNQVEFRSQVVSIKEPYQDAGGMATPYFYRLGRLSQNSRPSFHPNINEFLGCSFNGVPVIPNPRYFLNANKANSNIDLGLQLTRNTCVLSVTHDTASGALYVPGAFGVRVNE